MRNTNRKITKINFARDTSILSDIHRCWIAYIAFLNHSCVTGRCLIKLKDKEAEKKKIPSISAVLASSSSRLSVTFISASSSFSFIEYLSVIYGRPRVERCMLYNVDYVVQNWCLPDEIDFCYFPICPICITIHNNNLFNKTLIYSLSKFCL